jgi:hypothetical protein
MKLLRQVIGNFLSGILPRTLPSRVRSMWGLIVLDISQDAGLERGMVKSSIFCG